MKCFLILSSLFCQTKIILDVVAISFYGGSDFVGVIPFFGTTNTPRIGTKILFRINVYHFAARGGCERIITCAVTLVFASRFILDPLDFGTDKLISDNTASEFRYSFIFHRKRIIMRTAGNPIFIDLIILLFKTGSGVKWDISFTKVFIISESIAGKKLWVECCSIKSSITKESFGIDQWMLGKEVFERWNQKFRIE